MPTQNEYNVSKQLSRILYTKINLLNFKYQIVDELSGVVLNGSTFSINATSDIRRTCNISLIPTDASFDIQYGNKIWLDKYIQIYIGIKNEITDEIEFTNMGIYYVDNPSRTYNATSNTLTIQGVDLMAKMTGMRNGNLEGMEYIIKANSNIRNSIIQTIGLAGFYRYVCEECEVSVPNDINIKVGGTVYDILKQLRDIMPQYQIYFDVDGVFHYEMIPSGKNEQIFVSDDLWQDCLIDYSINTDFESVKNVIEVIGKTHDIANYGDASLSGNTYNVSIAKVTSLRNNLKVGFTTPNSSFDGQTYLNINSLGAKPIKYENGTIPKLLPNVYYVVKYQTEGAYFMFMGEVTPYGIAQEENPNSPFNINGDLGKIRLVLSGGDYDNIYTSELAQVRADWELYNYCKLQDNVTINCVPIYWLDVNKVVEITLPNKQGIETTEKYIIKSINTTLDVNGTQSITMMKYYPYYE